VDDEMDDSMSLELEIQALVFQGWAHEEEDSEDDDEYWDSDSSGGEEGVGGSGVEEFIPGTPVHMSRVAKEGKQLLEQVHGVWCMMWSMVHGV
jgi:hypothetical protein